MALGFSFNFGLLTANRPDVVQPCFQPGDAPVNAALRVHVFPRWYNYVVAEWSYPSEWGRCSFNVYHSTVVSGPFTKVNEVPITSTSLVDFTNQDYSKFRQGYYVVEAILLDSSNQVIRSLPTTWQNTRSPWVQIRASEIQRREYLLLRKFTGVKSYLFRRKMYGQRCPDCWDPISETVTNDHCQTCFGTSFVGGYSSPIPLFVQYDTTPSSVQHSYIGKVEANSIGAWTIAEPAVFSGDVLLRSGDWNMYTIGPTQPTELQSVAVKQSMQLTQLGRRDVENYLVKRCIAEFPVEFSDLHK